MSTTPSLVKRHQLATLFVLIGAFAWLLRSILVRFFPVQLPAPTGPYGVGRVSYDWLDASRDDPYARRPGEKRELPVTIWYPAAPAAGAEPGAYLPGWWKAIGPVWGFDPARVRAHAVPDVPAAPGSAGYPALVFSPSGSPPHSYTALFEELASHGYVVAGVAHTHEPVPLTAFSGGRVRLFKPASIGGALSPTTGPYEEDARKRAALIDVKAADLRFVADRLERLDDGPLAGRLDLGRFGVFGHSFGGAAAERACRLDRRFGAGAGLDAALWREPGAVGVDGPFAQIFAEHPEYVRPCEDLVREKAFPSVEYCGKDRAWAVGGWARLHESADPGYCVLVRGARHVDFIDWSLLSLAPWSMAGRGLGTIGGRRMWRVTSDYLLAFFDRHLKDQPSPLLDGPSPDHSEVLLGAPEVLFEAERPANVG